MSSERRVSRARHQGPTRRRYLAPAALVAALVVALAMAAASSDHPTAGPTGAATRGHSGPTQRLRVYRVRPGDTLSAIAQDHDLTVLQLQDLNHGLQDADLQSGQRIRVPR